MAIRTESALTLRFFKRTSRPSDVNTVGFCLPITVSAAVFLSVAISGRTLGVEFKQTSLGDHQVRQAKQGHQLCRVLGQSAVTGLLHAEAILDDVKGMLDLGSDSGLDCFSLIAQTVEPAPIFLDTNLGLNRV